MPVNSSLNLPLLHLTTVTFQKYFWMAILVGLSVYLPELRLKEIFRDSTPKFRWIIELEEQAPPHLQHFDIRLQTQSLGNCPRRFYYSSVCTLRLGTFGGQEHSWFLVR